jgi:hypothetical protein
MTHILVDSLVAPPDHAAEFSESIVLLPPTFYVNDHMQYFRPEIRDAAAAAAAVGPGYLLPNITSRLQHKLPLAGAVMANFNQPYKMNAASVRAACVALASNSNTTWWTSDGPAVYSPILLHPAANTFLVRNLWRQQVQDGGDRCVRARWSQQLPHQVLSPRRHNRICREAWRRRRKHVSP